jgi:hypothetical protein
MRYLVCALELLLGLTSLAFYGFNLDTFLLFLVEALQHSAGINTKNSKNEI